jgi:hypothetical protein
MHDNGSPHLVSKGGCFSMRWVCGILTGAAVSIVLIASPLLYADGQSDSARLTARIAELESKLANLSDRQQIHDVYLRYMRGFDRNDVELMRSAFWPDVQINYGSQSNTFDEFVSRHLNRHVAELSTWGHLITNESVDIDGDLAHVETYVTALWMPKDENSFAAGRPIVGGRYIDRLDRRNGEWRIAVREVVPHFQLKSDVDRTGWNSYSKMSKSNCALGTWDRRDPSYLRPLSRRSTKDIGPPCAE